MIAGSLQLTNAKISATIINGPSDSTGSGTALGEIAKIAEMAFGKQSFGKRIELRRRLRHLGHGTRVEDPLCVAVCRGDADGLLDEWA